MTIQPPTNPFREWTESLAVGAYRDIRRDVIDRCKINGTIFRNWRLGITAVPELAKPIINEIAGYEVYKMEEV